MRERSESGLSIKAFCESAGFHTNVYYYWQRKLREVACEHMAVSVSVQKPQETHKVPSGWAVCETAKAESEPKQIIIEIGKIRIIAEADVDSEHLSKVCRTLLSLC